MDILAGVVGGLGLFIVGMWFLTENLRSSPAGGCV